MTKEKFWQAVKKEFQGPEHNDYYVLEKALDSCLKVMGQVQRRRAIRWFRKKK